MTPQERDLITALLTRLQQQSGQEKDPEADALIRQATSAQQDADYLLVQTVLIQDMALHDAQHRIAELERQLGAQSAAPQNAPSFLPSRGGSSQNQGSSVPAAGAPNVGPWGAAPSQDPPPPRQELVWSQNITPPQQPAQAAPPPSYNYAPPSYGYGPASGYGPSMLAGGGGGFLRQAAVTAAGVVGGELLFQGIHSMFSPTYGSGFLGGTPMQPGISETVINNYYNDPAANDPNTASDPNQNNDQGTTQADYSDNQDYSSDQGQDFSNDESGSFNV